MKLPSWSQLLVLAALGVVGLGADAALGDLSASDPRAQAQALLATVKKHEQAEIAREPVAQAEEALKRAADLRTAEGEGSSLPRSPKHAELVEALALEWAQTAHDLLRAADAEQRTVKLQQEVEETRTKAIRARALVEETLARRNRALAKLELIEAGEDLNAGEPAQETAPKDANATEAADKKRDTEAKP